MPASGRTDAIDRGAHEGVLRLEREDRYRAHRPRGPGTDYDRGDGREGDRDPETQAKLDAVTSALAAAEVKTAGLEAALAQARRDTAAQRARAARAEESIESANQEARAARSETTAAIAQADRRVASAQDLARAGEAKTAALLGGHPVCGAERRVLATEVDEWGPIGVKDAASELLACLRAGEGQIPPAPDMKPTLARVIAAALPPPGDGRDAPEWIPLLPAGEIRALDGRRFHHADPPAVLVPGEAGDGELARRAARRPPRPAARDWRVRSSASPSRAGAARQKITVKTLYRAEKECSRHDSGHLPGVIRRIPTESPQRCCNRSIIRVRIVLGR